MAGCLVAGGCGDDAPPRVPDADAEAIFRGLARGQLFSPQLCGNVARPLAPATRRAYARMIRVAAADPDAELQSPDFVDHHPPIREWMASAARAIAVCRAEVPAAGPGWAALQSRLERAAGARA